MPKVKVKKMSSNRVTDQEDSSVKNKANGAISGVENLIRTNLKKHKTASI